MISKPSSGALRHVYQSEHDDKSGGGNGGSSTEEQKAAIETALASVARLEAKNAELIGKNKKLTDETKKFEGVDVDQMKALMSRFENDEEAKLIRDGKIDEVVNKRTERLRADQEKLVREAGLKAQQAEERANKFSQRVLDNQIRAAAAKAGLHTHAVEDALFRGRNMFVLDDAGEAVQVDKDGHVVYGKDGKTPFTPSEWLDGMKDNAPHWFPSGNSGGGASGTSGSKGGAAVVKRAVFDQMSQMERIEFLKQGGKIND